VPLARRQRFVADGVAERRGDWRETQVLKQNFAKKEIAKQKGRHKAGLFQF
jgi:hypothetical protein